MPKFNLELKQSIKGVWHVNSLKIEAEDTNELDTKIDSAISYLKQKIDKINKGEIQPKEIILNKEEIELFDKLRNTRTILAQERNLPPYCIFHDSTLKQFAKDKPMTKEEMLNISGVGDQKFDSCGVYFLKTIRSSCLKDNFKPSPSSPSPPPTTS